MDYSMGFKKIESTQNIYASQPALILSKLLNIIYQSIMCSGQWYTVCPSIVMSCNNKTTIVCYKIANVIVIHLVGLLMNFSTLLRIQHVSVQLKIMTCLRNNNMMLHACSYTVTIIA